jgi:NAD(P)-dependent dehydrogenase (short-subunit alcohol dehydrogenase family)
MRADDLRADDLPEPRRRFTGQVVLVAGSTGMAASAARALAAEGGSVFVASRTGEHAAELAASITAAGGRCAWLAADLSREGEVEAAVEACVSTFGRLDALYAVAGISGRQYGDGPLHEATLAGWEAVMAANSTSTFLVARAVVRRMLARPPAADGTRGALLLMSSALASHPAAELFATHAYAASKGAIEALTRALAAYYAPHGIRVNAIAPALVATPMSRRAQEDPAILSYLAGKQPLAGGPIDPDAVTAMALALLSDDARMVTGQVVTVDGGWSVSEARAGAARARASADLRRRRP